MNPGEELKAGTGWRIAAERLMTFVGLVLLLCACHSSKVVLNPVAEEVVTDSVLTPSMVDRPPELLRGAMPTYPEAMRKWNVGGLAVLSFVITTNGGVRDIRVIRSNDASFATAAKQAVEDWRYEPAVLRGKPVECRVRIPITYFMDGKK